MRSRLYSTQSKSKKRPNEEDDYTHSKHNKLNDPTPYWLHNSATLLADIGEFVTYDIREVYENVPVDMHKVLKDVPAKLAHLKQTLAQSRDSYREEKYQKLRTLLSCPFEYYNAHKNASYYSELN